ncbi:MAG: NAD(P)/FAD-dependent oxidoreductase [Crenarchaeota archaeon]|nr:NAD(P)/FAD-dependent oxidoreductase [Thermoproteota archaeon]
MKKNKVVIVGAGPASLSAAKILSRHVEVLLIGRQYRPEKPCGGGLTQRCIRMLRKVFPDYVHLIESEIRNVLTIYRRGTYVLSSNEPLMYTVKREVFDKEFLKNIVDTCGVEYIPENVTKVEKKNRKYEITTDRGTRVETEIIIAGDGVTSRVRKCIENIRYRNLPLALRTYCSTRSMGQIDIAVLDFSKNIEYGYYWIFPLRNTLNIGVGSFRPCRELKNNLEKYVRTLGLERTHSIDGHNLPEKIRTLISEDGKILYIGDAAGLIDYTLGEGITYAVTSGIMAAIAYLKNRKNPGTIYVELMKDIVNDLKLTRKIAIHVPYRIDRILDMVIRRTITTGKYSIKILRGQETYHKAIKKLLDPRKTIETLLKP